MNAVERVKAICKERRIPISKLEKDLGFANGYISSLRRGTFPDKRLYQIANYLDVEPSILIWGYEGADEKTQRAIDTMTSVAHQIKKETGEDIIQSMYDQEAEDRDVMELREELRRRPETKILFHASKNAPASAILEAAALIERYKEESKYK